jgi:hypothetical protein
MMLSQKRTATPLPARTAFLNLPPGELSMRNPFWIGRYLLAFLIASAIIGGAQFLKGHALRYSVFQALIWGPLTAGVYIATAIYRFRKARNCVLCSSPETPPPTGK